MAREIYHFLSLPRTSAGIAKVNWRSRDFRNLLITFSNGTIMMSFLVELSTRFRAIAHADAYNKSRVKVRSERKVRLNRVLAVAPEVVALFGYITNL